MHSIKKPTRTEPSTRSSQRQRLTEPSRPTEPNRKASLQIQAFFNYDSTDSRNYVIPSKTPKRRLKYSFDANFAPIPDQDRVYFANFSKPYVKKFHNPRRAQAFYKESENLKEKIHNIIDTEFEKFKLKLQEPHPPQSKPPSKLPKLRNRKKSEEARYATTYGAFM